jgi:hypothetical protein
MMRQERRCGPSPDAYAALEADESLHEIGRGTAIITRIGEAELAESRQPHRRRDVEVVEDVGAADVGGEGEGGRLGVAGELKVRWRLVSR